MRQYVPQEERDSSGSLVKMFFAGQINSSSKYFYSVDNLNSVREMTDNLGSIQAEYTFDPYGRVNKVSEVVPADFQFCGYYSHPRSGLNLTRVRDYDAHTGRFLSRDPIGDPGLYSYAGLNPIGRIDPSGLQDISSPPTIILPIPQPLVNVVNGWLCAAGEVGAAITLMGPVTAMRAAGIANAASAAASSSGLPSQNNRPSRCISPLRLGLHAAGNIGRYTRILCSNGSRGRQPVQRRFRP